MAALKLGQLVSRAHLCSTFRPGPDITVRDLKITFGPSAWMGGLRSLTINVNARSDDILCS